MVSGLPSTSGTAVGTTSTTSNKLKLKTEDFIKMMITQLQQQDPTEPAKNDQLLAQMSQISQLQSSTDLTDSLKGMVQQNQVGSAATLIGKRVTGLDSSDKPVEGLVTSVRVTDSGANLELDGGQSLAVSRVTAIGGATAAAPAA
jgi:flagellar basal-body rod modification protein FlgD